MVARVSRIPQISFRKNGPERQDFKTKLFADIDASAPLDSIIAPSPSEVNHEQDAIRLYASRTLRHWLSFQSSAPHSVSRGGGRSENLSQSGGYVSSKDFWTLGLIFGAIYLGVFLVIGVPISDFTRDRSGGIDDFGRGARDQSHESRVCFWDRSRRIRSDRIFSADFLHRAFLHDPSAAVLSGVFFLTRYLAKERT
jgi:hypothetical protein